MNVSEWSGGDATMPVRIYFCRLCGFATHAEAIARALESELGLSTELHEAFWGTFRIEWSGREIYNRWRTRGILGRLGMGHTPTAEEIVVLLSEISDLPPPVQSSGDET
ncbi:MAG: Rdx family protein [Planctomycetota bacterium]|nr:Rdx family protein [Planctomycetota bacterium]